MAITEKLILEGEDRASAALRKAGGAFDDLDKRTSRVGDTATKVNAKFDRFGKNLQGGIFAAGVGLAIGQLGRIANSAIQAAIDAGEAAAAFETTFGPAVGDATAFVEEFAHMAGFTTGELQQMLAVTGNVVQGIGATEAESADLAETMARLAGDVASFSNAEGGAAAVMQALQSAINGEREALKTYGLAVSEAEVQTAALSATGKTHADQLTRLDKAYATVAVATQKAGKAVGDLERTQDSAANRQRDLQAQLRETWTTIGEGLLPAYEALLGVAATLAPTIERLADGFSAMATAADFEIPPWVTSIPQGLGLVADVAGGTIGVLSNMGEAGLGLARIFTGDVAAGWDQFTKGVREGGGAIEDAVTNAQVRTGLEALNRWLTEGQDQATAYANALAFLDRNGELSAENIERFARAAGIDSDIGLLNVLRFLRDQTDVPISNVAALAGAIEELERTAFMRGDFTSADAAMLNSARNAGDLAVAVSEAATETGSFASAAARARSTTEAWASRVDGLVGDLERAAAAGENVYDVLTRSADPVFQAIDAWESYGDTVKAATEDGTVTAQEELEILKSELDLQAALSNLGQNYDEAMQAIATATGRPIDEVERLFEGLDKIDGRTFTASILVDTHYTETGPRPRTGGGVTPDDIFQFATGTWSVPGGPGDEIPATLHGTEIVIPPEGSGGRADFARQLAAEIAGAIGSQPRGALIGSLVVYADDRAGGEAAADAIEQRLTDLAIQGLT